MMEVNASMVGASATMAENAIAVARREVQQHMPESDWKASILRQLTVAAGETKAIREAMKP